MCPQLMSRLVRSMPDPCSRSVSGRPLLAITKAQTTIGQFRCGTCAPGTSTIRILMFNFSGQP